MHKNTTKCNEMLSKWCKNKYGASKIIDTFETYQSPKAPVKKVVSTRGSKRLKKSTDVGASLDTHRSTSSSDDVRVDPGIFALFLV
jgi:hypothetical protein